MKKTLLVLCAVVSLFTMANAQVAKIETSEPFEEPSAETRVRLIQTSNGNTLKISYSPKEGFSVDVYDKTRTRVAQEKLTLQYWNKKDVLFLDIQGVFEINNDVNIFISELFSECPHFVRITLNTETGKLKEEKLLVSFGKRTEVNFPYKKIFYISDLVNYRRPIFSVEKSQTSDDYVVVICDKLLSASLEGYTGFPGRKIEVVHYDKNHTEINRASFDVSPFKHQYIDLAGIFIDSTREIILASYTYDKKQAESEPLTIILSKLRPGTIEFEHKTTEISEQLRKADIQLLYNPGHRLLQMYSLAYVSTEFKGGIISMSTTTKSIITYFPMLRTIDPQSMTFLFSKPITRNKLDDLYQQISKTKEKYDGLPSRIAIDQDHSTTLLFGIQGNIGILNTDERLLEKEAYIFKDLKSSNDAFPIEDRRYSSIPYINTKSNNRYLLYYNTIKERIRGRIKFITSMYYSQLANGQMKESLLFGKQGDYDLDYIDTKAADFKLSTGVYATLKNEIEVKTERKQTRIAWITFE